MMQIISLYEYPSIPHPGLLRKDKGNNKTRARSYKTISKCKLSFHTKICMIGKWVVPASTLQKISVRNRQDINKQSIHINSKLILEAPISPDLYNASKSLVTCLILSDTNRANGIPLSSDMPFGSLGLMNITRPAVLRVYFGINVKAVTATKWKRVTYGSTSTNGTLSMDPRSYTTKAMSQEMYTLGKSLQSIAKTLYSDQCKNTEFLRHDYNHCTVLIYNARTQNVNCKLAYHCDSQYKHNGQFSVRNTMSSNSAVLVYSLGDERSLYFRKRHVTSDAKGKHKWKHESSPCQELKTMSQIIIHSSPTR